VNITIIRQRQTGIDGKLCRHKIVMQIQYALETNLIVLFNWQRHRQQMRSKALQSESTEQPSVTDGDLVAKKHALMSELASTVSASQILERDIQRLRKDIVTTGIRLYNYLFCFTTLFRKIIFSLVIGPEELKEKQRSDVTLEKYWDLASKPVSGGKVLFTLHLYYI